MRTLPHRLDRTLVIHAKPATVFGFFTNSVAWASWWGAGSTIDARRGGSVRIVHPDGTEVSGEVLDVEPPDRIVFSYGLASGTPIPPGSSRVTIALQHHPAGTLLQLTHEFAEAEAREQHVQGWRFQLSLFVNVVANTISAAAVDTVDRWFSAWSDPHAATREPLLRTIVAADIRFRDRFSAIAGSGELAAHLAAVHRFMPGMRLERRGDVRHCQWHLLADWVALADNGQERGRGTNLFVLDADGRVAEVTGFWAS